MEKSNLDLDSLSELLMSLRTQLDEKTLAEIAVIDLPRLQEAILETLGVPGERLSAAERETLAAIIQSVLQGDPEAAGSG